jgi:hypothetical protein
MPEIYRSKATAQTASSNANDAATATSADASNTSSSPVTGTTTSLMSPENVGQLIQTTQQAAGTSADATTSTTKIDFTHMSPNELGRLVTSGAIHASPFMMTLSDAQLKIAGRQAAGMTVTQAEIDAANNTPFNYLESLTKVIDQDRAMGMDTRPLQSALDMMNALQGKTVSTKVPQETT